MAERKPEVVGTATVGGRDYIKIHQGKKVREYFTGRFNEDGHPIYRLVTGGVTYYRADRLLARQS